MIVHECMYYLTEVQISLFCFFFFKQKTAYEMRISDWSSDVCSSDLRILGLASAEARLLPLRRFLDLCRHRRFARSLFPRDPRIDRGIEMLREIGRASCRERVCQYV